MKFSKSHLYLPLLAVAITVLAAGCGVSSEGIYFDDIYADNAEIAEQEKASVKKEERNIYKNHRFEMQDNSYAETMEEDVIPEDTVFDIDDYYDYAYTARIKRFHRPRPVVGYYDDFYTNLCWYDDDPIYWGSSIYLGYHWWYPSWSRYYWGWGWNHWYGSPWHYDPWGWGYAYHHHPYYYGWHHYGWGHHYTPYFNSRDRNSNFYRPNYGEGSIARRNNNNGNNGGPGYRGEPSTSKTFGDSYIQRYGTNNANRSLNNNTTITRNSSKTIARNTSTIQSDKQLNTNNKQNGLKKQNNLRNQNVKPMVNRNRGTINNSNRNASKLNNSQPSRRTNDQKINNNPRRSYTPPAVKQQRNTNEYRSNQNNSRRTINSSSRSNSSSNSRSSFDRGSSSRGSSVSRSSSSSSRGGGGVSRGGRR